MDWNTDFTDAPKGKTRLYMGKPTPVAVVISCGMEVFMSIFNVKTKRWSGVPDGQEPDAWMLPKPWAAQQAS